MDLVDLDYEMMAGICSGRCIKYFNCRKTVKREDQTLEDYRKILFECYHHNYSSFDRPYNSTIMFQSRTGKMIGLLEQIGKERDQYRRDLLNGRTAIRKLKYMLEDVYGTLRSAQVVEAFNPETAGKIIKTGRKVIREVLDRYELVDEFMNVGDFEPFGLSAVLLDRFEKSFGRLSVSSH